MAPSSGPGPAVLLIPSPWGLTRSLKDRANDLADAGFSVLVPDLNDGVVAETDTQAMDALMAMDMNVAASLIQSSLRLLRNASADPLAPLGVVGFAAGASWALWLAERMADDCAAVVAFYGTQTISFERASAKMLIHVGDDDEVVTDDEIALLGLALQMARCDFVIERPANAAHGFAEREHPNFDEATDSQAWTQSLELLEQVLMPGNGPA